jgi:hypothetical protein
MRKFLAVCLSAFVFLTIGCHHRLQVRLQAGLSKPEPLVVKGDVIRWYNADGTQMSVTFAQSSGSPCREGKEATPPKLETKVCHVVVETGVFSYQCTGCKDPVVPVGKDMGVYNQGRRKAQKDEPEGYIDPVGVACPGNNAFVDPQTVHVGDQFQWFPTGASPVPEWSFTLNNVCVESPSFDQDRTKCTVNGPTGAYSYVVTVPQKCTGTNKYTATITIVP